MEVDNFLVGDKRIFPQNCHNRFQASLSFHKLDTEKKAWVMQHEMISAQKNVKDTAKLIYLLPNHVDQIGACIINEVIGCIEWIYSVH